MKRQADVTAPDQPDAKRTVNNTRHRRIVFTINNWTDEEYTHLTKWVSQRCVWMVVGKETGSEDINATPHLQGAMCFRKAILFKTIKSWYSMKRAHIEPMYGSPQDSLVYCSKQDKEPFIYGKMPEQGKRNDIHEAYKTLHDTKDMKQTALEHPSVFIRYHRGLNAIHQLIDDNRSTSTPPTVYWLYGETGTGKTKCAYEFANNVYGHSIWLSNDSLHWFDGYTGQHCAIFDDFRAKNTQFNFLLRLLDRYPLRVPIKGSYTNWKPRCILITTPNDPRNTFKKRAEYIPEDINQLERRITGIFKFPDEIQSFTDLYGNPDGQSRSTEGSDRSDDGGGGGDSQYTISFKDI